MRKAKKTEYLFLIVPFVIIPCFVALLNWLVSVKILHDINNYELYLSEMTGTDGFMPNLDELNSAKEMELYYQKFVNHPLIYDSYYLRLTTIYDENSYLNEKKVVFEKYNFLITPPISDGALAHDLLPDVRWNYEANDKEYLIQLVDSNWDYRHEFGMIATCDTAYEICYLMCNDVRGTSYKYNDIKLLFDMFYG